MEENNEKGNGCLGATGGCLVKIIGLILMILAMAFVKTCSKSMMRSRMQYSQTEVVDKSKEEIDNLLNRTMLDMRAELPKRMDETTVQKDVQMDDDYFYYIVDIDDAGTAFSSMSEAQLKQGHRENFKSIVPGMRVMIEYLVKTDRGLVYRFDGTSSGVSKDVRYSKDELSQFLQSL